MRTTSRTHVWSTGFSRRGGYRSRSYAGCKLHMMLESTSWASAFCKTLLKFSYGKKKTKTLFHKLLLFLSLLWSSILSVDFFFFFWWLDCHCFAGFHIYPLCINLCWSSSGWVWDKLSNLTRLLWEQTL